MSSRAQLLSSLHPFRSTILHPVFFLLSFPFTLLDLHPSSDFVPTLSLAFRVCGKDSGVRAVSAFAQYLKWYLSGQKKHTGHFSQRRPWDVFHGRYGENWRCGETVRRMCPRTIWADDCIGRSVAVPSRPPKRAVRRIAKLHAIQFVFPLPRRISQLVNVENVRQHRKLRLNNVHSNTGRKCARRFMRNSLADFFGLNMKIDSVGNRTPPDRGGMLLPRSR